MSAKLTKSQLKSIVKECLIEILQEGLSFSNDSVVKRSVNSNAFSEVKRQSVRPQGPSVRSPSSALIAAIKTEARGNDVMADILADTAMTTLPNMLSHGDSAHGGLVESGHRPQASQTEQFSGDPGDVFGPAASKWADLAFMSDKKLS